MSVELTVKEKNIHFIGCGGIGMLGLALMANEAGAIITGSDITINQNTNLLNEYGIKTFIGHDKFHLPYLANSRINKDNCIVVYSSAVKNDNIELSTAKKDGIKTYKRGIFLGFIAKKFEKVIAVSGSHGKTSVTAMISHVLINSGLNPGYYIGGVPVNWKKNASLGAGKILVVEADESDLSLMELNPDIGIILNLDDDHAWNVGGIEKLYNGFYKFAKNSKLLLPGSSHFPANFIETLKKNKVQFLERISYDLGQLSQYTEIEKSNIITVLSVVKQLGLNLEKSLNLLKNFSGVERRMSNIFSSDKLIIIEDYAHHPTEIRAVVSSIKNKYKNWKLVIIFQPHREKRLKYCFEGFVKELKKAHFTYILPVYGAWEDINEHLEIKLANAIGKEITEVLNNDWKSSANIIMKHLSPKTILLLLGAGDINQIIPLLKNYEK